MFVLIRYAYSLPISVALLKKPPVLKPRIPTVAIKQINAKKRQHEIFSFSMNRLFFGPGTGHNAKIIKKNAIPQNAIVLNILTFCVSLNVFILSLEIPANIFTKSCKNVGKAAAKPAFIIGYNKTLNNINYKKNNNLLNKNTLFIKRGAKKIIV